MLTSAAYAQSSAEFSGRATDAAGRPIRNAVVRLVSDPTSHSSNRAWRYTLIGDSLGKFSQEGIAPGAYLVMLFTDGKGTDMLKQVTLTAGNAAVVNFQQGSGSPLEVAGTGAGLSMGGRHRTSAQTR
jgi:hypothetical protein